MSPSQSESLWAPRLFLQLMVVGGTIAALAFFAAYRWFGELALRDIIGGSITTVLAAYLVHLWLIPWRSARDDASP